MSRFTPDAKGFVVGHRFPIERPGFPPIMSWWRGPRGVFTSWEGLGYGVEVFASKAYAKRKARECTGQRASELLVVTVGEAIDLEVTNARRRLEHSLANPTDKAHRDEVVAAQRTRLAELEAWQEARG